MVELTPDERSALKELVEVEAGGGSVRDFVNNRLFNELSYVASVDNLGNEHREHDPGFDAQMHAYVGLYEKGLLDASPPNRAHAGHWFRDLTGDGRFYFDMEAKAKKEKDDEKEDARRYARKQALIAFLASTLITLAINAKSIYDNIAWIASSFS